MSPASVRPTSRCACLAALWRDRRGAQAVEFALTIPITILLIVAGLDFGRLFWTISSLHLSCEQAARCWTYGACTSANVVTFATNVVPQLGFSSSVFSTASGSSAACQVNGVGYQVSATYNFSFIPSDLFPSGPTLRATACLV